MFHQETYKNSDKIANYILVIDDDPLFLDSARAILENANFIVQIATAGDLGLRCHEEKPAALIVLDISMPGMDGFQVIHSLRLRHDKVPILVLTAHCLTADRIAGMQAGADDYLGKPFSAEELVERIRAILRRTGKPAPAWRKLASGPFRIDPITFTVHRTRKDLGVSLREFRLLEVLVSYPQRVFSRRALVNMAWDYESRPTLRTVDYHVASLRRKLGLVQGSHPIRTVEGEGFCWILPVRPQ